MSYEDSWVSNQYYDATIKINADVSPLLMYIDNTLVAETFTDNVTDTANDWVIGSSVTPYIEYWELDVAGVQKCYIDWEYSDTAFTDDSGNGNTAVPTFRTTASDNVTAELISYQPVEEAKLPYFTMVGELPTLLNPDEFDAGMYTDGDYTHIPGAEAVNEILVESDVPQALWWFPVIYFSICIIGFIVYGATQGPMAQSGSSNPFDGSLLTMAVVMEALIVVAGIMNPVPLWPAYLFPIPAMAIIISRKHFSWG